MIVAVLVLERHREVALAGLQRCPVDEREHGCADLGVADTVIEQHRPDIAKPERCGVEIAQ